MEISTTVKHSKHLSMKNKDFVFYGIILVFVVIFLASSIIFKVFQIEILPSQLFGALIGVFITAIVTAFLLRGQTEGDEKREKSVKVFEKKQEIYHDFLEKFQKIIQDGDIKIGIKKEDGTVDYSTDKLKDLIFQLAFIQMHTSTEQTKKILLCIADIKEILNDFNETPDEDKHKKQEKFYSELSTKLFEIVAILKADLYDEKGDNAIPKIEMESILKKFDLYVEVKDADKYQIQTNFWEKLCQQLKEKGYGVENIDIKQKVNEFYSKTKFCTVRLTIEDGVIFEIVTEGNLFYYGFPRSGENVENTEIEQRIRDTSPLFKPAGGWWHGWKYPDRYKLDFMRFTAKEFENLKNPRKIDSFIKDLSEEIDRYIRKFEATKTISK